MDVFNVGSRHTLWLQDRQSILAENIANSDTPAYRARDLAKFSLKEVDFQQQLLATDKNHFGIVGNGAVTTESEIVFTENTDIAHSGNSVVLEREMKKVGETASDFAFDASILKLFHRLTLLSVKG
jgi:flagellar basal-body rod protein FlgB